MSRTAVASVTIAAAGHGAFTSRPSAYFTTASPSGSSVPSAAQSDTLSSVDSTLSALGSSASGFVPSDPARSVALRLVRIDSTSASSRRGSSLSSCAA